MKFYTVYTEDGAFYYYETLGVADAVDAYYATDGKADDAPLAVGAMQTGHGRYSVYDNDADGWV